MNFALSTILLFVFLLPGLAYRRLYYSRQFSRQYFKESFFSVFSATFIPALLLHSCAYWLAGWYYTLDFNLLGNLLTSQTTDVLFERLKSELSNLMLYSITLTALGGLFGWRSRWFVRKFKLDIDYKLYRYRNSWHYVISGEVYDFPESHLRLRKDKVSDISFRSVDATQSIGGQVHLYQGILVDYQLSNSGGLETLSLKEVKRRLLSDDGNLEESGERKDANQHFYPVKGHLLILKYEELSNLNFTYWVLEHENKGVRLLD